MTLSKLAVKNIRKSIKDYSIYFMTLVLGVVIFYIFNAIESQTAGLKLASSAYEIIKIMNSLLSGVSVFVAVVLGGLIIYASRFLIKRRNREFGVYLTLGMSKRKMSGVLFFETLLIGAVSLVVGLILGTVLSQFMSILVANLFEADMSKFTFVFSPGAAVKTCIYFGVMYLVVMIFNTVSIGKCKLIDLLQGEKKSEKMSLKNPIVCTVIFVLSVAALVYAYREVTVNLFDHDSGREILIIMGIGSVATFFFFWSVSGMLLTLFKSMKGVYFRKLNSFVLRQFSSKANTMVISMTVICLMLFLTIVMLGSALSLSESLNKNLRELVPCDVNFAKIVNFNIEESDYEFEDPEAIVEDSKTDVVGTLKNAGFDVDGKLDVLANVYSYGDPGLTMGSFCGDELTEASKNYLFIFPEAREVIMKLSDYNKVAEVFGREKVILSDDQYAVICDFEAMIKARNKILKQGKSITVNGHELSPAYDSCLDGAIKMSESKANDGLFVVPDNVLDGMDATHNRLFANYRASSNEEKEAIEKEVEEVENRIWLKTSYMTYVSKMDIRANSAGLAATATFLSLYIGLVFLIASAAILSLKELSESADNVKRFDILRRIGTDEKFINSALFKQIGMFFLFPMLLAVVHSVFGLKTANIIFEAYGIGNIWMALARAAIVIVAVYGGYFLLTYFASRRIIKSI